MHKILFFIPSIVFAAIWSWSLIRWSRDTDRRSAEVKRKKIRDRAMEMIGHDRCLKSPQ